MSGNFFSIKNLCISRSGKTLYENFSLAIEEKKITALLAPSGAGKTTLFYFIAGLLNSDNARFSGEILFSSEKTASEKFAKARARFSFLFQENRLLENISLQKNIFLPLANRFPKKDVPGRADFFLKSVFLFDKRNTKANAVSGGEKRRCAFARALSFPSDLLLLDEPFSSQDTQIKEKLILLLKKTAQEEGRTVFFATHDIDEALFAGDRIIVLQGSPLRVLFDEKVSDKNKNELREKIMQAY